MLISKPLRIFVALICFMRELFDILQVMDLAKKEDLVLVERRISISEFHTADEVDFITFYNMSN